ncbi:hypothetical protein SK571_03935 [Lentzea sp. BCCO 10_0798]|uniref:Uncharacterized protein n=1 Tax=Lentzea kristufekii TaxID=3095430 RepID=A0ABU4TJT1_9PSEU|nr:hypothetical protein [Lentzea sp. BCCO 10_0798]MDX8048521.1 hypothetical protein [Lentzea sp. BCCO 10_0798]
MNADVDAAAGPGGPSLRRWSVWISLALVVVLLGAATAVLLAIGDGRYWP